MAVWYSLWPFAIFFPNLICLDEEKSGNPGYVIDFKFSKVVAKNLLARVKKN
jgi:hypothetical protein